jgi:two-component system, cell cycle sensor histidine kinase and response regulator CckA
MNARPQLQPGLAGSPDPALLLAAIQASPDSLAIVASGLIVYANPAWCGMFECPDPAQLRGRTVEDLIPAQPLSVAPAAALPAGPNAVPNNNDECEIVSETQFVHTRKDGTRLAMELAVAGFHLRGREFQVIHSRDITRQNDAEKRLRGAQTLEAIGRLVGGVAHDFNNLLTGIMLYCDLLIAELGKDSRLQRHALEMRTASEHGAALVQQLLTVARPSVEESRILGLNDVVRGLEDLLTRLLGEDVVLSTSLAADLGAVRMDPSQVQQILLNLVLNARDAMPDGGQITLTTRNLTEPLSPESISQIVSWVELMVTDTGSGMDAETLERAFEPFFTTKKPGRGNGLGLATARRLVRQEGGTIVAESEPGKGTRISVRLPRVQSDSSTNSKAEVIL